MYLDLLCPSCNMILISIFYSFFSKCGSLATRTCLALHIQILLLNVFRLFFETDNNQNVVSSQCESKFCHFWNKNWVLWHAHRGKTNIFGDFCSTVYIPTLLWMHINSCLTCLWEICGKPSRKCTFYTTTNNKNNALTITWRMEQKEGTHGRLKIIKSVLIYQYVLRVAEQYLSSTCTKVPLWLFCSKN